MHCRHPYEDDDLNSTAEIHPDFDPGPAALEYGDELTVSYEKVTFGSTGSWTLEVEVIDVTEYDETAGYDIDVRETEGDYSKYTVSVSEYGISVSTNYPNAKDNQQIGTNATVEGPTDCESGPNQAGRACSEEVVSIRIDETPAPNGRVTIHVTHPDHDRGVRCFHRHRDGNVARSIRRHITNEIDAELERVELEDTVGLGLTPSEILPDECRLDGPAALGVPEVVVV